MNKKVYRDNKYSGRRMRAVKKSHKKGVALATTFGVIIIVAANLIPFNVAKADDEATTNPIYVETIDNGDSIDFKNVDYPISENKESIVIENTEKAPDPFSVGSNPDKKMVIDFLSSPTGQLVYKYASDYGVDPNIMASIAMQETTLNHDACIPGGEMYSGYGVGLMQLESPSGEAVTAYNYNTNEWDTEYVTMDNACNLETNIKIGCMMFQKKLKENCGNVFLATQSHNYGQGMIDMMMNNLYGNAANEVMQDYSNASWITEIENIHNNPGMYISDWNESGYGDGKYLEHVFGHCPVDEVKYKYGAYEYTFNLKTMKVTDMFEYSTSMKK